MKDAWILAIETLSQIELQKLNEQLALARTAKQLGISNSNAIRYAYRLIVETIRQRNLIDKFINDIIAPKSLNKFSLALQAFLRLYVYQTRVAKNWVNPDFEEAARIAKLARSILGWKTLRVVEPYLGFLLSRQIDSIVKGATDAEQIALKTFQPTWFVVYCFRVLGRNETVKFLEGNIYPPPTFIRLNTLRASQEEIVSKLEAEGVKLLKIKPLKHTYKVVESKQPLTSLISYREGMLYVQDKASCFVSEIANPQPHTTILDVCAAPGAKTTHLAQLMKNQGTIYSIDYSTRRIRTWKTETQRMNVTIAEPVLADARSKLPVNVDADVVVLDPPCTSTGSFGRQPSGKWRLTANSYEAMAQIQWFMINTVAENVKPQGSLIYTTDSIMVEENELIIERFLKWHPEFHLTKILPEYGLPGLRGLTRCRRFYPNLHESNSTFIAKLQKT